MSSRVRLRPAVYECLRRMRGGVEADAACWSDSRSLDARWETRCPDRAVRASDVNVGSGGDSRSLLVSVSPSSDGLHAAGDPFGHGPSRWLDYLKEQRGQYRQQNLVEIDF